MNWFKKILSRFGFRQRYNLAVLGSITIAATCILFALYVATLKYTSNYTRQYWQEYTDTFAHTIKYSVILHSASISKDIIQNFSADRNVLKASVFANPDSLIASSGTQVFKCDFKTPAEPLSNSIFFQHDSFWCFYSPLFQNNHYLGYVELVVSTLDLDSLLNQILLVSGLIVLIVLLFIYFVIHRLSAVFTNPMQEIVNILKNVSSGIRGNRVYFSGGLDIKRMGEDFNNMLIKIENNEQSLEQAVADRTSELKIALDSSYAAINYKNQIMTLVSHEMKTPLHNIGSYLELIEESLPKSSEFDLCRTFNSSAMQRTQDLNDLINKVLVHGKLEANKVELTLASFNINNLIKECVTKLTPALTSNRNQLSISGTSHEIISDIEVLRHIVNNLLSNACKFTFDGEIKLCWQIDDSELIIQVADNGQGIPAQYQQQIFTPFWQADMSLTREQGGHGLGLSITKRFTELLGGNVTVFSEPGQGALFTVKIPV